MSDDQRAELEDPAGGAAPAPESIQPDEGTCGCCGQAFGAQDEAPNMLWRACFARALAATVLGWCYAFGIGSSRQRWAAVLLRESQISGVPKLRADPNVWM